MNHPLRPNSARTPVSIRKTHIQNLIDLLHACLLRGELERATRAWSILIRCREVDWRSRWRWGLALISASSPSTGLRDDVNIPQWLRALRITVPADEKPSVLHALILHLIRQSQYREALDELETYLTSYPYLLSGTLHTYAGMLAFYLAQPDALRPTSGVEPNDGVAGLTGLGMAESGNMANANENESDDSDSSSPHRATQGRDQAPNASLIRQARGWFVKAQDIGVDDVAAEFVRLIDSGPNGRTRDMSEDEDEGLRHLTGSRRNPSSSLKDMLHPPSDSDEEDEDESVRAGEDIEDEMVDALHEYE